MLNEALNHEDAFEAFAVNRWKEAEISGDTMAWSRVAEQFFAVQLFLTSLRLYPLANTAADLKVIADMRAGVSPQQQTARSFKPRIAARS